MRKLSKEDAYKDITLDDVEIAIQILEHFFRKMQEAQNVLRRVQMITKSSYGSNVVNPMSMSFNDIVKIATEVERAKRGGNVQPNVEQEDVGIMSEDDVKRAKELVKKLRKTEGSNQ